MNSANPIKVTMLMPCLNEELSIVDCVRECQEFMKEHNVNGEVLVADNGSTDRSCELAQKAGARVVHIKEKGYGSTIRGGIEQAKGEYVIMADSDMSYNFKEADRFISKFNEGYDFVIGCRLPRGGGVIEKDAMPWANRWFGTPAISLMGRILFRTNIIDFNAGMRGFKRDTILKLKLKQPGMEFASEMIAKASRAKIKIAQVPISLRKDKRGRKPHLRPIRDGLRHVKLMLTIAFKLK